MVTVATAYDFPNKLVMPVILNSEARCAIIGLGDIMIPGLYLSFLDKFGSHQYTNSYLYSGLIAYGLSLLVCMGILLIFDAA